MIKSKDRSGYIGASDTKFVIGNWETKTFRNWWLDKLGLPNKHFNNKYTMAGTNYEHKIIDALNIKNIEKDKQIIVGKLRVNLDANTDKRIHEIKTYQYEKGFDLKRHKDYVNQVLVQMYASGLKEAEIDAYGLLESDYRNYFNDIDIERLLKYEIEYNNEWINKVYLPRFKYLEKCLEKQKFPIKEEFMNEYALYKGDKLLAIGTAEEIAKEMNIKIKTLRFYLTPTYQNRGIGKRSNKRRILIKLEELD